MEWRNGDAAAPSRIGSGVVLCGDPETSRTLFELLADSGLDIVVVGFGKEALAEVAAGQPALVVVDTDGDPMGFVTCSMLRERYGELLPIVLVSGERTDTADRVSALLLGADDYVVRPFEPTEVIARLRRLLTRSSAIREAVSADRSIPSSDPGLTPREREVLTLLVAGLSQHDIARELVISGNTVAAHIQRILQKLGVRNRAQAVAKAMRGGLVSAETAPPQRGEPSLTRELGAATRLTARR